MMSDKVYVVCATGIDTYGTPTHEVYNHANKTQAGAEKVFLSYLEDFYGKGELEEIRQEYPKEFKDMLKAGFYQCNNEAWSSYCDKEATEVSDFQLDTLSIQVLNVGE